MNHPFGMPLHAGDPVVVTGPFHCFNHAIRRMAHDAQIPSRLQNRLVVRAIDVRFGAAGQLRQARTGCELRGMVRLRTFVLRPVVLDLGLDFAGNVLHERSAEIDVEALDAVADREDGLLIRDGVMQKGEVGALAVGVGFGGFGVPRGVKFRRIDVGGAAREDDRVEGLRGYFELRLETEPRLISTGIPPAIHTAPRYLSYASRWLVSSSFRVRYGTPTRGREACSGFMMRVSYHPKAVCGNVGVWVMWSYFAAVRLGQ